MKQCSSCGVEGPISKGCRADLNCLLCKVMEVVAIGTLQGADVTRIWESPQHKSQIRSIQINHCQAGQDLLSQTSHEENIDVASISQLYRNHGGGMKMKSLRG